MARETLGGRVVASRLTARLLVGDVVAILLFSTLGELRHGGTAPAVLGTAAEFGVGWVVLALLLGAYGRRSLASPGRAAALGAATWVGGAVIGVFVRAAVEPGATVEPVFVVVTAAIGAVILGGWRFLAARWLGAGREARL